MFLSLNCLWLLPYFHRFACFFREIRFQVVYSNDKCFLLAPLWLFSSYLFLFGSLFVSKRIFFSPFPPKPKTKNSAGVVHFMFIHRQSQYLFANLISPCISYNIIYTFGSPILLLNTNHNAVHCCYSDIVIVFLDNFQKKNLIGKFYLQRIRFRIVSPKRIKPNGLLSFQFGNEKAFRIQK